MKKSIILIFIIFNIIIFPQSNILKISEDSKIDSIGSIQTTKTEMILKRVVIDGVIVDRIYTNVDQKRSEMIITKADLKKSFLDKNKDIQELEIQIKSDGIVLDGKIKLLGMLMSMRLEGVFYVENRKELWYNIKSAKVNTFVPIPKSVISNFESKLNPVFRFDELGMPIFVEDLYFENDRIIFR